MCWRALISLLTQRIAAQAQNDKGLAEKENKIQHCWSAEDCSWSESKARLPSDQVVRNKDLVYSKSILPVLGQGGGGGNLKRVASCCRRHLGPIVLFEEGERGFGDSTLERYNISENNNNQASGKRHISKPPAGLTSLPEFIKWVAQLRTNPHYVRCLYGDQGIVHEILHKAQGKGERKDHVK